MSILFLTLLLFFVCLVLIPLILEEDISRDRPYEYFVIRRDRPYKLFLNFYWSSLTERVPALFCFQF